MFTVDFDGSRPKSKEIYISILVCALIGFSTFKNATLAILRSSLGDSQKIDVSIVYIMLTIIIVLSIKKIFIRLKIDSFYLFLLFFSYWAIVLILNDGNDEIIIDIGKTIGFVSIPAYMLSRGIIDYGLLLRCLERMAYFGLPAVLILVVKRVGSETGFQDYSQWIGYSALAMTVILLRKLLNKFSMHDLIYVTIGFSVILASGARGPFACILIFLFSNLLMISITGKINKLIIVMACSILIFTVFRKEILIVGIQNTINSLELNNRVVDHINAETLFEDHARAELRKHSFESIFENPIFGIGIIRDRLMLAEKINENKGSAKGWYPHNIIIEILVQYGVILGIFAICAISYQFVQIINAKDSNHRNVVFIFFGIGVLPLLFSGSYLESPIFFAFLGFTVSPRK